MKSYIVLGLGRFGQSFAKALSDLGHDVLGVDKDELVVQQFSDELTHVMCAESSNEDFLRSVGIKNFDAAIVAIGSNIQSSILTTLILKDFGAKYVIAKAQNNLHAKVLYKVGADEVVLPERDMGIRSAHNLVSNNIIDYIELSPDYSIMEVTVPENWTGKAVGELAIRAKYGVNIVAIKNGKDINVSPRADTTFINGDVAAVIGRNSDLKKLQRVK